MRGRRLDSVDISSGSEATSADSDSDSESSDATSPTRRTVNLECLVKIAQKHNKTPEDRENFTTFFASLPVGTRRARKRRSAGSPDSAKKRKRQPERFWLCNNCDETFTAKDDLRNHQEICKKQRVHKEKDGPEKRFSCEACDKTYAHKSGLYKHVKNKHNNVAAEDQTESQKYKCSLCKEELVAIYKHYGTHHAIENVEQLLFVYGNVFVFSDIDPEKGEAPWFIEQLEKAKVRYSGAVCRLCEVDIGDPGLLRRHYTQRHKVDPDYLDDMKDIFRSEIGAHLGETSNPGRDSKKDVKDKTYAHKSGLNKHVKNKHNNVAAEDQTESQKYKCSLCKEELVAIYKHYGTHHAIENVEQLLFVYGNVFVYADLDPEEGKAPWFIEQLEKAKVRYSGAVCRLCEVDIGDPGLLRRHYTQRHKVDPDYLDDMKDIFRSEIGAHLGKTSNPGRDDKKDVKDKKKVDVKGKSQNRNDVRIIYKCKCGKATDSYDAVVEHSQEHLFAKHTGKEVGITLSAAFETDIDDNREIKVINYDFETLLTEAWFETFGEMTPRITSSSIYLYTRSVKFHSDAADRTGIPAYKCSTCQLFVDPMKIENHCKNFDTCVRNKPNAHHCVECDAHFYSANALAYHKENHALGFRLVTFNHKDDAPINKILGKLQNLSDDSQEEDEVETEGNPGRAVDNQIEINAVEQYCKRCEKWIDASVIGAHIAEHKENLEIPKESDKDSNITENSAIDNQCGSPTREAIEQPTQENVDDRMHTEEEGSTNDANSKETGIAGEVANVSNCTEKVVGNGSATGETESKDNRDDKMQAEEEDVIMNDVNEIEENVQGTAELPDSDDSAPGGFLMSVEVDIHVSVHENNTAVENAESLEVIDVHSQVSGDETLPCTQELERLFESDSDDNHEEINAANNDKLPTTQELQQMLENDDAGNDNLEQVGEALGISGKDTTQGQNGESVPNNEKENDEDHNVSGEKVKRMSARDIINEIISDDDVEFDNDEFARINALVSMTLSSRD